MRPVLTACPVCDDRLAISELLCPSCHTRIAGQFAAPVTVPAAPDLSAFARAFLASRGDLAGTAAALGVTLAEAGLLLDDAARQCAAAPTLAEPRQADRHATDAERQAILKALDRGEITAEEATRKLQSMLEHHNTERSA